MNEVQKWYADGQDFDEGYNLLFQHNPVLALPLRVWLDRNYIPLSYRQDLKRYIDALKISPSPLLSNPIDAPQLTNTTKTAAVEPSVIKEYRQKWYHNTNNFRRVHALMSATTEQAERGACATEIMCSIIPERTHISKVLEDWATARILPVSTDTEKQTDTDYVQGLRDGAAQMQRITNLTSRLNKINNKLLPDAAQNAERTAALTAERAEKEAEIIDIRQKLGIANSTTA